MTQGKGEITRARLHREWPHHVALPVGKVRGLMNSETVRGFADTLSAAPRTYSLRRGEESVENVYLCRYPPLRHPSRADFEFRSRRVRPRTGTPMKARQEFPTILPPPL